MEKNFKGCDLKNVKLPTLSEVKLNFPISLKKAKLWEDRIWKNGELILVRKNCRYSYGNDKLSNALQSFKREFQEQIFNLFQVPQEERIYE